MLIKRSFKTFCYHGCVSVTYFQSRYYLCISVLRIYISLVFPHHTFTRPFLLLLTWQKKKRERNNKKRQEEKKNTSNCLTIPKKTTSVCQMSARYKESCKGHMSAIHTAPTSFRRVPRTDCLWMLGTEHLRAWIDAGDSRRWGWKRAWEREGMKVGKGR